MEWGIWLPIKRLKIWRNRSNLCWQEMIRQRERLHIELILPKPISVVLFLDQTRFQGTLENLDKTNPAQRTLSHGHHHAPFILPTQKQIMKNARVSLKFHPMERRLVKDEFWRPFLARWTSLSFCNGKTTPKRTFNSRMFITWIHVGFENLLHSTFKASAKGERGKEDAKSEKKRSRHPTEKG